MKPTSVLAAAQALVTPLCKFQLTGQVLQVAPDYSARICPGFFGERAYWLRYSVSRNSYLMEIQGLGLFTAVLLSNDEQAAEQLRQYGPTRWKTHSNQYRVLYRKSQVASRASGPVHVAEFDAYEARTEFTRQHGRYVQGQGGRRGFYLHVLVSTTAEPGSPGPGVTGSPAQALRTARSIVSPMQLRAVAVVDEVPAGYRFWKKGQHNGVPYWLFSSVPYQNYALAVEGVGTFLVV